MNIPSFPHWGIICFFFLFLFFFVFFFMSLLCHFYSGCRAIKGNFVVSLWLVVSLLKLCWGVNVNVILYSFKSYLQFPMGKVNCQVYNYQCNNSGFKDESLNDFAKLNVKRQDWSGNGSFLLPKYL